MAAVFALCRPGRWWFGMGAAGILAVAHLTSSFAVVAAYALANHLLHLQAFRWIHVVAGGLLLLMAVHQWRAGGHRHHAPGAGHAHTHRHDATAYGRGGTRRESAGTGSLLGLAGFAFALGFVHEEEFAIIALAAGRANPWLLMAIYAGAVASSLVTLTLLAIGTFNRFESRLRRHEKQLPRVSEVILGLMGLAYVFRLV